MYKFVEKKAYRDLRAFVEEKLRILQKNLRPLNITMQIYLTGSGMRKLITCSDTGVYDLDYNLIIQKLPDSLYTDPGKLKHIVHQELDLVFKEDIAVTGEEHHSVIRYKLITKAFANAQLDFSIWRGRAGNISERLIHDIDHNVYIWNIVSDYSKLKQSEEIIKKRNASNLVRKRYLELKNEELSLSSLNIYLQAVNDTLTLIKRRK